MTIRVSMSTVVSGTLGVLFIVAASVLPGFLVVASVTARAPIEVSFPVWLLFLVLCGASGAMWSVPIAVNAWARCPPLARSLFWRKGLNGLLFCSAGGVCLGTGVFVAAWFFGRSQHAAQIHVWEWFLLASCVGVGLALWRLGGVAFGEAPKAARRALKDARKFLRNRDEGRP